MIILKNILLYFGITSNVVLASYSGYKYISNKTAKSRIEHRTVEETVHVTRNIKRIKVKNIKRVIDEQSSGGLIQDRIIYKNIIDNTRTDLRVNNVIIKLASRVKILEEAPSPMPSFVTNIPEAGGNTLYFVGSFTGAMNKKEAIENAVKNAKVEVFTFIGVKVNLLIKYNMQSQGLSDKSKYSQQFMQELLHKIKEIKVESNYYRKILSDNKNVHEAHALVSCSKDTLIRALNESIKAEIAKLNTGILEGKNKLLMKSLEQILGQLNEVINITKRDREALNNLRNQFVYLKDTDNVDEISLTVYLSQRNFLEGNKTKAKENLLKALGLIEKRIQDIKDNMLENENPWDDIKTRIWKRMKNGNILMKRGNPEASFNYYIYALYALSSTYQSNDYYNGKISEIKALLIGNINKLRFHKTYNHYKIVNNKIEFYQDNIAPSNDIYNLFFNQQELKIVSIAKRSGEGEIFDFYLAGTIIAKIRKYPDGKSKIRLFNYDINWEFRGEINNPVSQ